MNEIDSWILIAISVLAPLGFVIACVYSKPHKSHVWEMQQALFTPQKEEPKKKLYLYILQSFYLGCYLE